MLRVGPVISRHPAGVGREEEYHRAVRELRKQARGARRLHPETTLTLTGAAGRYVRRAVRHDATRERVVVEALRFSVQAKADRGVRATAAVTVERIHAACDV